MKRFGVVFVALLLVAAAGCLGGSADNLTYTGTSGGPAFSSSSTVAGESSSVYSDLSDVVGGGENTSPTGVSTSSTGGGAVTVSGSYTFVMTLTSSGYNSLFDEYVRYHFSSYMVVSGNLVLDETFTWYEVLPDGSMGNAAGRAGRSNTMSSPVVVVIDGGVMTVDALNNGYWSRTYTVLSSSVSGDTTVYSVVSGDGYSGYVTIIG